MDGNHPVEVCFRWRRSLLVRVLVAGVMVAAGIAAQGCSEWREKSPIKIQSAKRTETFQESAQSGLKPRNPERDVILVVEFTGISAEEFQKVKSEEVYLEANGEKYKPAMTASGRFPLPNKGGKTEFSEEKIVMAVAVPRDARQFKLHVGTIAPRTVKAGSTIEKELKM